MEMKKILSAVLSAAYIATLAVVPVQAAGIATDISDGDTVAFDKGVIKIDSTLDFDELRNGLVLKKRDGSAITGGQYVREITDETYEYELVFGSLEDGEAYTLYYNNDDIVMFDANGYVVNEDFDDWTDEDISDLTDGNGKDGLYLMLRETYADRDPVISLKDREGGKYLAVESGWSSEVSKPNSRTRLYSTDMGLLRQEGVYEDILHVTGDFKWYGTSSDTSVGTARMRRMGGLAPKSLIHENTEGLTGLKNNVASSQATWLNVGVSGGLNSVEGKTFDNGWHSWNMLYQKSNYAMDIKFDTTRVSGGWGAFNDYDYDSVLLAFMDTNADNNDGAFAVDNIKIEKVKGPQVLYTSAVYDDNEVVEGSGNVEIYFNTDINASSVNDITFTDGSGTDVKTGIVYNDATRSATLSYSGLTAGEEYTINFPNTVKSEKTVNVNSVEQYAAMQAQTLTLKAVEEAIEVPAGTTADIEDGAVIPFDKRTITITSTDFDVEYAKNNLELTKSDGSPIKGSYYVSQGDNGIDVVFADLEYNTDYVITCGGYSLNFTSGGYAFEEDFNDWTDADIASLTGADGKDNLFMMTRDKDSETNPVVTIKDKGDGDKYLDIDGTMTGSVRFRLYTGDLGMIRDEEGNADYLQVYGDWKFYGSDANPYGYVRGNNATYKLLGGLTSFETMQSKDKGMYEIPNSPSTTNANWVSVSSDGKTYNKVENAGTNGIGNDFSRVQMLWATAGNISTGNYGVNTKANGERIGTTDENLSGSDYNAVALGYFMTHSTQGCDAAMSIDNIQIRKIKAPRILKTSLNNNEITAGSGTVDVYFTTDVNPSSLSADTISITDSENVNRVADITYTESERKATITYTGLNEGEATLAFAATPAVGGEGYAAIQSAEKGTGNESHAPSMRAQSYSLTAVEGEEGPEIEVPFICLSTDLASMVNVDTAIGKIVVNFNQEVDDATISGITMQDEKGNAAPNFKVTASGNTCILTFSVLETGMRYIITVPESVKSASGTAVTAKSFSFRTLSDYLIDLDFEDYTVTESTDNEYVSGTHPKTDEGITYTSNGVKNDASNIYVMAEGSNKYLRIYADKSADGTAKDNMANVPVELDGTNSLSIEMKVRWASSDGSYGDKQYTSGTIGRIDGPKSANVFIGNRVDGSIGSNSSGRLVQSGQGVGTWLDIKLVYTPDTNGVYMVHGYYNGEYILTVQENKSITSINNILFQHVYNKSTSLDGWGDLDDIKVKYVNAPYVANTNLVANTMPVDEQILEMYFSDEMDAETVLDNNITVTYVDKTTNETVTVESTGMYYPALNKYVISFPDYLTPDTECSVNFSGVRSADRIFTAAPFTFMSGSTGLTLNSAVVSETAGGNAIDKIPSSGNVAASAVVTNNTGKDGKAVVILAAYDKDGKVLKIETNELTVSAGNTKTVPCSISGVAGANEVKMYVWNGLDTICPILTTPVSIN